MSKRVQKYSVPVKKEDVIISMPIGAKILCVAPDPHVAAAVLFWAEIDTEVKEIARHFAARGTDVDIPLSYRYLGTAINEFYVWHLFEREAGFFFGGGA